MVSRTHTIPISLGIFMGTVWEWYGKVTIRGSHYWGSLKIPLILSRSLDPETPCEAWPLQGPKHQNTYSKGKKLEDSGRQGLSIPESDFTLDIQSYLVRIGVNEPPFTSPEVRLLRVPFTSTHVRYDWRILAATCDISAIYRNTARCFQQPFWLGVPDKLEAS